MNKYKIQTGPRIMKTTDLFKLDRSAKKLNESLAKTFGRKLNLEAFDMPQLEDARNKLRTQIHTARSDSSFNENLDNEAFTEAQWMLDAINAELEERQEHIADANTPTVEGFGSLEDEVMKLLKRYDENANEIGAYGDPDIKKIVALLQQGNYEDAAEEVWYSYTDQDGGEVPQIEPYLDDLMAEFEELTKGDDADTEPDHDFDQEYNDESIGNDVMTPQQKDVKMKRMGAKPLSTLDKLKMMPRQMKAMAQGDSEDDLVNYNKMKARRNESIEGDNMATLNEGEIQQAQSIVTAKTMVDRVGRWIEELSGMENDTLLQLGDQIRDEQGQEQAKMFISSVAPAIQQALENLKSTREALASGVRTLTGEEQSAGMLGAEPEMGAADLESPAEPDTMNPEMGADIGAEEVPADDFAAAEPAAGGLGDAGRAKRESIERSNSLLKVLAG
jgi:hypothetical protein